ncbi:nucleoside diphosphate kinase [Pelagophyceae sp. CCMP2097]|nr:nucleoside diphosphate kinase [Pelagophyceae sp. CCMP2097]
MSTVYGIIVNWYDPQPMLQREYVLRFFPEENHIEMYDTKSRRTFLRKSPAPPSVNANELYIGNEIMVHSRALKIVGYLDPRSKEFLSASQSTSVAFISPDAFRSGQFGSVLTGLTKQGFTVKQLRLLELNEAESEELASLLYGSSALPQHVSLWSAGRCVAVCLGAQDAVSKLAGAARLVAKAHGGNGVEGVVHCTEDGSSAAALADFAFGSRPFARSPTARYGDCACCVIRPHAVKAGHVGGIVQMIEEAGFEISAAQLFKLDVPAAAEFLEVYDGVVPDYDGMVRELASSECVALELRGPQNCAAAFRDFAGPWDVDFAKELRPKTIRAKFGVDRVQNAVHCTELADDAEMECQYFFDVLQG